MTDARKVDLDTLARAYAAAGTAAFANFNSLVVDELAQAVKDVQRAKQLISQRDPIYALIPIAALARNFLRAFSKAV